MQLTGDNEVSDLFNVDKESLVNWPWWHPNADDDRCEPGDQSPGNDIDLDLFTLR